jgi:site-specific DNA-methyltransferase (adenine-specific)
MFSFAGDTILDPFGGTGSTAIAAVAAGRNSISLDIEPLYVELARSNLERAIAAKRETGAIEAELLHYAPVKQHKSRGRSDLQAVGQVSRAV